MTKNSISWFILFLLFVATGLNFLDRQVLSMTIIKIQKEFNISDFQYGLINTSFLISYALMFTVGGRLIDLMGGKWGMALAVGVWSIASGLHGIMSTTYELFAFRFLLGIGEGGCFPGAAKTVCEWFDETKRGFANGIAIGGSALGAVIAPPLTILVTNHYGWRWGFIIPAVIGAVWVVCWLVIPWKNRTAPVAVATKEVVPGFLMLLKNKKAIIFIIIRFLLDPVMYFIMFWTPKYLSEQRHVSFERIGELFWIPFLALGVSNIIGGWTSDKLIRNKYSVNKARKLVMGFAALLTLCMPFITLVSSVEMAILLISVMLFAHGFWITNYITLISDVFGTYGTSTIVGLSGTAGAISALLINPLIGKFVQNYSYNPLWILSGVMYPLAFIVLIVFIPRIRLSTNKSLV